MRNLIAISGKINSGKSLIGKIIQYLIYAEQTENYKKNNEFILELINDKNLSYTLLEETINWEIKQFSTKLKEIICILLNCTFDQLEDREFKEKELGEEWWCWKSIGNDYFPLKDYNDSTGTKHYKLVKLTPRLLMQLLGTQCFRNIIHPNTFINALFSDYKQNKDLSPYANKNSFDYPSWIITDLRFKNELQAIKNKNGITIRVNRITGNVLIDNDTHTITDWQHPSETELDNEKFDYIIENDKDIIHLIKEVKKILVKEKII